MKIISLEINPYCVLKSQSILFPPTNVFPEGAQIIGIIGPNGSGKTTFCSAIAHIFHSFIVGRPNKFDYKLSFEIEGIISTITHENGKTSFDQKGTELFSYQSDKRKDDAEHTRIAKFTRKCGLGKIILSTFETKGEYPSNMPYNFRGHDNLVKYDVASIYGKNLYGYPSISQGILRLLLDRGKNRLAHEAFDSMELKPFNEAEVKIVSRVMRTFELNSPDPKHPSEEDIFIKYLKKTKSFKITTDTQFVSFAALKELHNHLPDAIGNLIYINGLTFKKQKQVLSFNELSSGEKFFIVRYLSILSAIENDSIIIIEEPENHLNPSWRELFIPLVQKMTTAYRSCLIFTTHDYRAIRYLHNSNVLNMNKGHCKWVETPTLLCDEFDFEGLGATVQAKVLHDIETLMKSVDQEKRLFIINSLARVPEKKYLMDKYLSKAGHAKDN